jgi:PilZ domain
MERRTETRQRDRVPVIIDRVSAQRFGVTRDMGASGVLLNTPSALEPGERVRLTFHALKGITEREGTVLRRFNALPEDPWGYRVAVKFA